MAHGSATDLDTTTFLHLLEANDNEEPTPWRYGSYTSPEAAADDEGAASTETEREEAQPLQLPLAFAPKKLDDIDDALRLEAIIGGIIGAATAAASKGENAKALRLATHALVSDPTSAPLRALVCAVARQRSEGK